MQDFTRVQTIFVRQLNRKTVKQLLEISRGYCPSANKEDLIIFLMEHANDIRKIHNALIDGNVFPATEERY